MAYSAATLQAPALPLMMTGLGKRAPLCNVTISNVPGAPQILYLQGARLDEAYPVSIPMDYNALNITVSSYADTFAFGFIACRRTVPGLQRMIDHTDAALAELRKALGKTALGHGRPVLHGARGGRKSRPFAEAECDSGNEQRQQAVHKAGHDGRCRPDHAAPE